MTRHRCAQMADTYARVQAGANGMYIYQKYVRIFEHRHMQTIVPAPLNLPWTLFDVLSVKSGWRKPWSEPVSQQRDFADGALLLSQYREAVERP